MTLESRGITLLRSDSDECQFRVSFQETVWDTLKTDGQIYQRPGFFNTEYSIKPGQPMLPGRSVLVAVPPGASVQVNASAADYREYSNIRVLPCPRLESEESFSSEIYEEGPAYQQSGFQPGSLIEESGPSHIGDLRVMHLRITPVQYDPIGRKVRIYDRVSVQVRFSGGEINPSGREDPGRNAWIDRLVVNGDMARRWLKPPRSLKKYKSTFSGGPWYKIPVTEEGIYKLSGKTLKENGIELSGLNVDHIKLYNNGGQMLPRDIRAERPDALIEIPLWIQDGGDGTLNENDLILFYGKGVEGWIYDSDSRSYSHYTHLYDSRNIYWLTIDASGGGKRITPRSALDGASSQIVDRTPAFYFFEDDKINPNHAGIRWYAQEFTDAVRERNFSVDFRNPAATDTLLIRIQVKGSTPTASHTFSPTWNGMMLPKLTMSGNSLKQEDITLPVTNSGSNNTFRLGYSGSKSIAVAYLDWFEVHYSQLLQAGSNPLFYRSPDAAGLYTYQLTGFNNKPVVWDVTEIGEIQSIPVRESNSGWACVDRIESQAPKKYIAFRSESASTVSGLMIDDQISDLRNSSNGADMIIITHSKFFDQALRLKEMRESHDTLSVQIVNIDDVYDEFGWGLKDPTAIRDFMVATMSWDKRPRYLLLFGDGTYIYKDNEEADLKNWIPPYELDTLDENSASAVDEWFVRVIGNDSDSDVAVGRLPVQTEEEAKILVDKIIEYETEPNFGLWRTLITLVADDVRKGSDENHVSEMTHTDATEHLFIYTLPPHMNVKKIYLTEYDEVIQADGRRKPGAKADMFEQINLGTVLVNYIGHGNEKVWAHEQVLLQPGDLNKFNNPGLWPLMYGATCTFARFDLADIQSLAESVLLIEDGGSIASVGATRECFAAPNEVLNRYFLDELMNTLPAPRIGEALRLAKIRNQSSTSNNQKYTLLGDPALRLALPQQRLVFSQMDPDTFKALSVVDIHAELSSVSPDFQGNGIITAYDSEKSKTFTFLDDDQDEYSLPYQLPGNTIFRGKATMAGGELEASFIVPKDISYGQQKGRISLYAFDDQFDAAGYKNEIPVGGSVSISDTEGPEMFFSFAENPNFITGGLIPADPELVVEIEDKKTGINITGEIGHKLMLALDDMDPQDVSAYFQYNQDSYLKGKLQYRLSGLDEGLHTLSLKAWDNANNSSTASFVFQIVPRGEFRLQEVMNYPNPFSSSTHFTFQISHFSEIEIKVYTVDGRLIRKMDGIWAEPGFNMIYWDGRDDTGDALSNGVYLYKIEANADVDGKRLRVSEMSKIMVYR